MHNTVYNSRDLNCKTPYGAVPCNTEISLTLRPLTAEGFLSCTLVLYHEFADETQEVPLSPAGTQDGSTLFSGAYTAPETPELIWYYFRFAGKDGTAVELGKNGFCRKDGEVPEPWQQTVYEDTLSTPEWFGRGITYQIFPDRFCRTSVPDPAGMPGHRKIHQEWSEPVELPEQQGANVNGDFYGGTLAGITEKLDYLHSLHITTLYLCPVFESDSNHRYNTADYERIDPMLGTEDDFCRLCEKAHNLGIRVMLDGVFNHTGSNSRYFNASASYSGLGAAQSMDSPYYPWYTFKKWPNEYDSWWGVRTMPSVNEMHPDYIHYIVEGENSIIRRWLRNGADAWRLDVADELPDEFIARIRAVMMKERPDSFLLGEVWEDGSNKISYDRRRRYLLGRETHGLMNYPFRVSALAYLQGGDAAAFKEAMESIRENYPPQAFYSAMNMLGTHDTPRILTLLGGPDPQPTTRQNRLHYRLSPTARDHAVRLLKIGALLLYTFPGSPTVFYGDEAGMEGYEDPMNRGTFPWGSEDPVLQSWYTALGQLRVSRPSLRQGSLHWHYADGPLLVFTREYNEEVTAVILNPSDGPLSFRLPWSAPQAADCFTGSRFSSVNGQLSIRLPALTGMALI